jgi:uncharacterized protein YbcI
MVVGLAKDLLNQSSEAIVCQFFNLLLVISLGWNLFL